jgi:polyisoprenyl-teichoic acid--peptidoglycan teichoic acid transferase
LRARIKTPKKKRRIFPYIILVIIFFFGSGGAYAGYLLNQAANAAEKANAPLSRGDKSEMRESAVQPLKDNVSLLIMGIDESEVRKGEYGDSTRTDALMYATFNMKEKSVKLLSIPRDSYVTVPNEKKKDKINHVHAYSGVEGTIDTVEYLLDVPVDYYVKVNFESFLEIVNLLGGIEVDVPVSFTEQDSSDTPGAIKIKKGYQTLNGEQALALARTRKLDSDLERGKRQMLVIEAIAKKAIAPNTLFKLDGLLSILGDNMKTNMTFSDITSFYKYAASLNNLQIDKLQLEGTDGKIDGIYYYMLDQKKLQTLQQELRVHLDLPEKKPTKTLPTTKDVDSPTEKKEQTKAKAQTEQQKQKSTTQREQQKSKSTTGTTQREQQNPKSTTTNKQTEQQRPTTNTVPKQNEQQRSTTNTVPKQNKQQTPNPPATGEQTTTSNETNR